MTQIRLPHQGGSPNFNPNPFQPYHQLQNYSPTKPSIETSRNCKLSQLKLSYVPTNSTYHHINFMGQYISSSTPLVVQSSSCTIILDTDTTSWKTISDQMYFCDNNILFFKILTCGIFLTFKVADYIICKVFVAHMMISINLI